MAGTPFDQPIQSTSQIAVAAAWLFVGLPGAVPCRCAGSRINRRANGRVRQGVRSRRVVSCPSIQASPVMVQCTGRCLTTHSSRLRFAARLYSSVRPQRAVNTNRISKGHASISRITPCRTADHLRARRPPDFLPYIHALRLVPWLRHGYLRCRQCQCL